MIQPHDLDGILAARIRPGGVDDWAEQIRARERVRSGLLGCLDHAADGPRRLERIIGGVLGAGLGLLWLGWTLGRR